MFALSATLVAARVDAPGHRCQRAPVGGRGGPRHADYLLALASTAEAAVIVSTKALFPVGLLRRYLEAQEVDGRELLVFDSDEEVSSEVAARMLGVSRPFLNELLEVETISYRRVGNQRRIRVLALHEYSERRKTAEAGLRQMADVVNESAGGWNQ